MSRETHIFVGRRTVRVLEHRNGVELPNERHVNITPEGVHVLKSGTSAAKDGAWIFDFASEPRVATGWVVDFDPNEPRVPAGSSTGGEWTSGGGAGGAYVTRYGTKVTIPHSIPDDAKAKGFDIVGYHATRRGLQSFVDPAGTYRSLTFFSPTPEGAEQGMIGGANDLSGAEVELPPETRPITIMPAFLRSDDIEGLAWTPAEKAWHASLPNKIVGDADLTRVWKTKPKDSAIQWWSDVYAFNEDEIRRKLDQGIPASALSASVEYTKKPIPTYTYGEAQRTNRDIYGRMNSGYNPGGREDQEAAQRTIAKGMAGFLISDEGGLSIAHALPHDKSKVTQPSEPSEHHVVVTRQGAKVTRAEQRMRAASAHAAAQESEREARRKARLPKAIATTAQTVGATKEVESAHAAKAKVEGPPEAIQAYTGPTLIYLAKQGAVVREGERATAKWLLTS